MMQNACHSQHYLNTNTPANIHYTRQLQIEDTCCWSCDPMWKESSECTVSGRFQTVDEGKVRLRQIWVRRGRWVCHERRRTGQRGRGRCQQGLWALFCNHCSLQVAPATLKDGLHAETLLYDNCDRMSIGCALKYIRLCQTQDFVY